MRTSSASLGDFKGYKELIMYIATAFYTAVLMFAAEHRLVPAALGFLCSRAESTGSRSGV